MRVGSIDPPRESTDLPPLPRLSFLAARTTAPHPAISAAVKGLFNAMRTVPELIVAIIFVAAVACGPLPGILARTVGSTGSVQRDFMLINL
jgi:phosphonate transport system permease protein